jgi:putative Mn2+ efflux pump MntP
MDAFAVSIGLALSRAGLSKSGTFRIAFAFGFFQFLMASIGWLAGSNIQKYIQSYDHWVAFGLLLIIGGKMIFESFSPQEDGETKRNDPTKGSALFILSVATSIDSLAVGLSLAVLKVNIFYPAAVIGVVAFLMTNLGAKLGPVLGRLFGRGVEFAGGAILIAVGLKILIDHL